MDQHGVLSDPAQPGALRQLALRGRTRVYVTARPRPGRDLPDGGSELLEPTADDRVVIGGPGVLSDVPGDPTDPGRKPGVSGIPGLAPGVSRAMEVIGQGNHGHAGVRHDAGGMLAPVGLAVQVGHAARVAGREPLIELVRMPARLEARDTQRIEPEFEGSTLHRDGYP